MNIDKRNGDLCFNEDEHRYFNIKYPNREYISVTTLISKYHEDFDSDFWSSYKALEEIMGVDLFKSTVKKSLLDYKCFDIIDLDKLNIDREELARAKVRILLSYKQANEEACTRGTLYHKQKEDSLDGLEIVSIESLNLPLHCSGEFRCVRNDFSLQVENDIIREHLLYFSTEDGMLNLAGQADVIVKQGNDIHILDYKTNAKGMETSSYYDRKKKKSKKMFFPINDKDDCMFQHYTLQLSLYAYMIQQMNSEFNIKSLTLLHIDINGKETNYPVEYIKEDVEKLLKHYKKELIVKQHRLTGKFPSRVE